MKDEATKRLLLALYNAVTCLRLEVDDSIVDDIKFKVDAVAAALRGAQAENEEWLRMAKRKDLIIDSQIKEIAVLKAERDAAFVRGLERAKGIAGTVAGVYCGENTGGREQRACETVVSAIQAEIDKAGNL